MKSNVAETIQGQIGNKALYMIGAKNLVSHGEENAISFRIGRNSKSVNYIKITLNALDLYDVEYGRITKNDYKVKTESKSLYSDMLNADIEENTGMYTRL